MVVVFTGSDNVAFSASAASHFTRSFKAAYGITPRAAREAALLGLQHGTDATSSATISRWMREIAPPRAH